MPISAALVLVAGTASAGVTLGVNTPTDAIPTLDNSYGALELAYNLGKAAPAGNITQNGIAFVGKTHPNGAVAPVYGTANGITIRGRADDDGSTAGNFAMNTADLGNDLWHTHSLTSKGGSMLLDITGLDTARNYQVQILFGEPRTKNWALYNAGTATATDAASHTASAALSFGHGAGDHAVVTIEVRDSTSLTFRMENNGGLNPAIAGVVVHSMPDPTEDSDSDGMYDAWEITHFGNLSHDGTADGDGDSLSDVFEFEAGLNPNDVDSDDDGAADPIGIAGYLSVEKWDNIAGATLADLTTSQAFYGQPSERYFTPRAKAITGAGDSYGLRMRGTIIAPLTGEYRFWISGDNDCELLLSTDARRFNKVSIASVTGSTNEEQWDQYSGQQSEPIQLVAGESYYLEVLLKEEAGDDHVAVAWEYSGQVRQVIPGANLRSLVPDSDDADDDGMLDSWERQVGLDPDDNGSNLTHQRAYSDIDGDGIPNWKEFASGGNPFDGWQAPASAVSLGVSAPTDAIPTLDNSYGALELAYNFGKASPEGDITQDGIPFEGKTHPDGARDPVLGMTNGITVRAAADDDGRSPGNFSLNPADLGDDLWHTVSYTLRGGSMFLEVTGLDADRNYQLQVLFGEPRTAAYNNGTISATTDSGTASASGTLSFGHGVGDHAVATLEVMGSGTVVLRVENDGGISPHISGLVIHSKTTPPGPTVDYDSDGMADAWEVIHFGNLAHDGGTDGDGDTLNDLMEFETGLNPTAADSNNDGKDDWVGVPGYLSVDKWNNIAGSGIAGLTLSQAIHNAPSESYFTPHAKSLSGTGDSYGLRMRGTVIAPRTGEYRFWIAGDDRCELFLSTDSSKFNKHLLSFANWTDENHWFASPDQQSERVHLIAGQEYHIEVLSKQSVDADHVAVAWDHMGIRQVIPGTHLRSYTPDPLDLDDDELPDAWETQVGLNATMATNNQGGYGDADGDLIINRDEWLLGTDPTKTDTDGDGVSDYAEIHTYGSNPLVVDTLHQLVRDFNLAAHTGIATGDWVVNAEGGIYSSVRRGSISYTFDVTTAGVHSLELGGRAIGTSLGPVEEMPLRITIDNISLCNHILRSENGEAGLLKILTPWLGAGQHQITILSDNIQARRSLQIDSLELFLVMGEVSIPGLGIFWLPTRLQQENAVTVCPLESLVSPVCIEGRARFFEQLAITGDGQPVTPMKAFGSDWYANVPLAENNSTAIDLAFENGNLAAPQTVVWVETDVLTHETLTIRKGDSLRLTGRGDLESGLELFDVTVNINNGGTVYQFTADTSVPHRFEDAGTYQIHCEVFENNDLIAANTLTVNVVDADFGGPFDVLAGSPREWTLPAIGPEIHIQPDPLMACTELTAPAGGGRLLRVDPLAAGERRLLARTGVGGPIIDTGVVRGYQTYRTDATGDTRVIQTFPNGDRIVMMSIVAPDLPPGGYIRLVIFVAGVTFLDGTIEKILTAADFDENGIAYVMFNFPEGSFTSICHNLKMFDAEGIEIGQQ